MKAKDLAEILLQHPELEVAFFNYGSPRIIAKVIKCNLANDKAYSFDKEICLIVDDDSRVRKSWIDSIMGEIFPAGDFTHDDTKGTA